MSIRGLESSEYHQEIYEENRIEMERKQELYEDAFGYLEEIKSNYICLKDKMQELKRYSDATECQTNIDEIDCNITFLKVSRDEELGGFE